MKAMVINKICQVEEKPLELVELPGALPVNNGLKPRLILLP